MHALDRRIQRTNNKYAPPTIAPPPPKGGPPIIDMDFKHQVDTEKQEQRDWIIKLENDEEQIKQDIIDLENALKQKRQDLIDKGVELEENRELLRYYDGRKYIKLKCLGFPDENITKEIFYGKDGMRQRLQITAATVAPRAFCKKDVFEMDFEVEDERVQLDVIDTGKLLVTVNVPQEYKKWHNEEIGDFTEPFEAE